MGVGVALSLHRRRPPLTRALTATVPAPAGYFVPRCAKMEYKALYAPSELRCAITGAWVPYALAAPRLAADKHARLVDADEAAVREARQAEAAAVARAIPRAPLLLGGSSGLAALRDLTPDSARVAAALLRETLLRAGPAVAARAVMQFN